MVDIYVYGSIGEDWTDEAAMTAHRFAYLMQQANGDTVTIHVNSGGGDVFDANAMAEVIRSYKGKTIASIEGLAASAASYFALTADYVEMNPSALLMIHNPWGVCQGGSADMRKTADMLDKVRGTIVNQYVRRTGMEPEAIMGLMDAETWFSAEEAEAAGFVDAVTDEMPIAACVSKATLDSFKSKPSTLVAAEVEPPTSAAEEAPEPTTSNTDERPTGDTSANISDNAQDGTPEVAEGGQVGSTGFVECVNGQFINHKE